MVQESRHGQVHSWGKSDVVLASLVAVDDNAARDGIPPGVSRFVTWVPVAGTVALVAVYVVHTRLFYWLLLEDHPVEWLQFALLFFTVLTAGGAVVRHARQGRRGLAALMVQVALGGIMLAGEEISWGERVFSLVPPTDLAAINKQRELNLHNIKVGAVSFNQVSDVLKLVMGLGAVALSLLTRPAGARFGATWLREVAPPLATVSGFALIALYDAVTIATRTTISPVLVYQEWVELCFYVGIAVTVACCFARAEAERRHRHRAWGGGHRQTLIIAGSAALLLTLAFAKLTADSGIVPGNVPPSLVELYQEF